MSGKRDKKTGGSSTKIMGNSHPIKSDSVDLSTLVSIFKGFNIEVNIYGCIAPIYIILN